jgi:hypothetical protein
MRVLIVIAVLVGAAFMLLVALAELARDLSRHSFQSLPDMDSDDWDVAADDFTDTVPPVVYSEERQAIGRHPIGSMRGGNGPGKAIALDDLRSAL